MGNYKEYKTTYFGESKVFDCNLVSFDGDELVISYRRDAPIIYLGIDLPIGSVSYGYYWKTRNYNVYHWKGAKGETLLFYFNISRDTKIEKSSVSWLDLVVDVAVKPGKPPVVLDEDEVPRNMPPHDLFIISSAKRELLSKMDEIVRELEIKTARLIRESSSSQPAYDNTNNRM